MLWGPHLTHMGKVKNNNNKEGNSLYSNATHNAFSLFFEPHYKDLSYSRKKFHLWLQYIHFYQKHVTITIDSGKLMVSTNTLHEISLVCACRYQAHSPFITPDSLTKGIARNWNKTKKIDGKRDNHSSFCSCAYGIDL